MNKIAINTPYITLGQFLKLANIISNGGEAKFYLSQVTPLVDGEPDNRRGRKLYPNMKVKIGKDEYLIVESKWKFWN